MAKWACAIISTNLITSFQDNPELSRLAADAAGAGGGADFVEEPDDNADGVLSNPRNNQVSKIFQKRLVRTCILVERIGTVPAQFQFQNCPKSSIPRTNIDTYSILMNNRLKYVLS